MLSVNLVVSTFYGMQNSVCNSIPHAKQMCVFIDDSRRRLWEDFFGDGKCWWGCSGENIFR